MPNDFRYAARTLRRQPGFTIAMLATLALGIGASTTMFSVVNAVLLRPLPHANAERVVRVYQPNDDSRTAGLSPLEIDELRAQAGGSIEAVVEYHSMPFTFIGGGEAQRLQTGVVSASYFRALGIDALVGRTFVSGEDEPGATPVLLLSYEYWQREFGGDPGVVGTALHMNDRAHTVVGVLPSFPQYPDRNDVYMPVSSCPFRAAPGWAANRAARGLAVFALLESGAARQAAHDELRATTARWQNDHPEAYRPGVRYNVELVPLPELIARPAQAAIVLLLAATILLLAIVCSNLGNLMVVRVLRRDGELAVRAALGAGRGRLLRQLMTETAVLAFAGAALGVLLSLAGTRALVSVVARISPRAAEIGVDATVLLFALGATAATALIAGVLPFGAMRAGIAGTLRRGTGRASAARSHARIRNTLLVVQVAVSLVLAAGAAVIVRTVIQLDRREIGFDPEQVTTARIDLNWTRYDEPERISAFFRSLEETLTASPGITAAGIGSSFPLNGDPLQTIEFAIRHDPLDGETPTVAALTASPGYFAALGVPLLAGRTFTSADDHVDAEPVVVITRAVARRFWPAGDAVGSYIALDGGTRWRRVVGVTGDVRHDLEGDFDHVVFLPHGQVGGFQARLVTRSPLPARAVAATIRAAVATVDAQQPITEIVPLETQRRERLAPHRLVALLLSLFAVAAIAVTAVGLGSSIAFSVAQRTREIAIRSALGARPAAVLSTVLGQTAALTLFGVMLGLVGAWAGVRRLRHSIAATDSGDGAVISVVALSVIVIVAIAGLLPARRAAAIPPARALQDG